MIRVRPEVVNSSGQEETHKNKKNEKASDMYESITTLRPIKLCALVTLSIVSYRPVILQYSDMEISSIRLLDWLHFHITM